MTIQPEVGTESISVSDAGDAIMTSLTRWMFFGVGLALLPIGLNALDAVSRNDTKFHFESLFQRGELLLVASAVLGAALAEMFGRRSRPRFRKTRNMVGCFAGLALLAVSGWFAAIQADERDHASLDHHTIALLSLLMFGLALVAGVSCVVVAQLEEPR